MLRPGDFLVDAEQVRRSRTAHGRSRPVDPRLRPGRRSRARRSPSSARKLTYAPSSPRRSRPRSSPTPRARPARQAGITSATTLRMPRSVRVGGGDRRDAGDRTAEHPQLGHRSGASEACSRSTISSATSPVDPSMNSVRAAAVGRVPPVLGRIHLRDTRRPDHVAIGVASARNGARPARRPRPAGVPSGP